MIFGDRERLLRGVSKTNVEATKYLDFAPGCLGEVAAYWTCTKHGELA